MTTARETGTCHIVLVEGRPTAYEGRHLGDGADNNDTHRQRHRVGRQGTSSRVRKAAKYSRIVGSKHHQGILDI